jgi:hypothetical protein
VGSVQCRGPIGVVGINVVGQFLVVVLTSLVKCSWLVLSVAKNGCIGVVVVIVLDITLNCC